MSRFLAVLILFVVGWAPVSAIALGLGDINLKSALNQPFVAEIPVATNSAQDLAALSVGIAPAATFMQYGLERASFLDEFEFEVVADGDNGIVRITSRIPVVEPFVTLLLEITWPQGRLLREFTVLLDPPVFAGESGAAAVAPPQANPAPGPTRVVRSAAAQPRPAPQPAPAPAPAQPAAATPAPAPALVSDSYGPVQRADTLWGIAGQYAEAAGVNRNQMMLAVFRANPEAFVGNINRLKAGMILRIPDADERQRLSRSEATAEVRRQNQAWRPETADAGRLRLVPPPDVDEDVEPVGVDGGAAAGAATGDQEASELQNRVRQLEEELAESRRLIEVQDQQLLDLQNQVSSREQQVLPGVGEPAVEVPVAEIPAVEEPALEEPVAVEPPPAVVRPNVVTTTPAEEPSLLGGLFTNIWLYIGLGCALILALFVVRRRSADADAPPWRRLDDDDGTTVGEETAEATQQLSPAPPATDTSFVVEEGVADRTDQDQVPYAPDAGDLDSGDFSTAQDVPETPLERTISTDSPVNLDEADPIAEADFHMAYGLYDQAADLLSNSLKEEPDRKDLRLKLLEVYFIWENQGGFLREAQALQSRVDGPEDADWNKVLIMGKQICPDEDLFSASPSAPNVASDIDFSLTDDDKDADDDGIDFDFSEVEASDVDVAFEEDSAEIDFDLSADDISPDADSGLDFDISEADEATLMVDDVDVVDGPTMESPIEPPSGEATMETPTIESPALDATMESPIQPPSGESTLETPTIESEALETTMETPTIESPIGDFDEGSGRSEQTAEIELDDLGLDLSGLDDAVEDVEVAAADETDAEPDEESTGLNFAAETSQIEIDSLDSLDDETQRHKLSVDGPPAEDDLEGLVDVEATGEMPSLGDTAEQPVFGDTVEQPGGGSSDTAEQPGLAAVSGAAEAALIEPGESSADVDFDVGDAYADSDDTTNVVPAAASVVNGATMTEVGTKLDLARAYIDMGDPDGARSILNEVLEEATDDQRQEAQKLLDDLDD